MPSMVISGMDQPSPARRASSARMVASLARAAGRRNRRGVLFIVRTPFAIAWGLAGERTRFSLAVQFV